MQEFKYYKFKIVSQQHSDQVFEKLLEAGYEWRATCEPYPFESFNGKAIVTDDSGRILFSCAEFSTVYGEEAVVFCGNIIPIKDSHLKPVYGDGTITYFAEVPEEQEPEPHLIGDWDDRTLGAEEEFVEVDEVPGCLMDEFIIANTIKIAPYRPLTQRNWKMARIGELVRYMSECVKNGEFTDFTDVAGEVADIAEDLSL